MIAPQFLKELSNKTIIFCILLFLNSQYSTAQSPVFQNKTLGFEKTPPKVECIVHDNHNRIFFGTNKGLIFYDGQAYQTIILGEKDQEWITSLAYDSKHVLWVGTNDGSIYLLHDGSIEPYSNDSISDVGKITSISNTSEGMLITSYGAGVYLIGSNKEVRHITTDNGLSDDYTYDGLEHNGHLWIATDGGIAKLTLKGESSAVFKTKDGLPDNIVHKLIELDDHTLAVGMYDYGVAYFNTINGRFTIATENQTWEKGEVSSLVYQDNGELWIGTTQNGIICLSFKKDRLHQKAMTQINGLISNRINCFHVDTENNIWIGTNKGVSLFTGSEFEFIGTSEGLSDNNVFDVIEDMSGKIWIANQNGVEQFYYQENGEYRWNKILENTDEKAVQIVSLFEDSKHNIWMGSFGQGLIRYEVSSKEITAFTKEDGLPNENILDIVEDENGTLWLATLGGGVISMKNIDTKPIFTKLADKKGVSSDGNYIYDLHLDQNQVLYYATDGNGVGVYDCRESYHKPLDIEGLNKKTVYSIASSQDGTLWFSIANEGLFKLKGGKLTAFGEVEGLRSKSISSLHTTQKGNLIVGHDRGIDVLQKSSDIVIPYYPTTSSSFLNANLNGSSYSGTSVWYGTEEGVVKFTPKLDSNKIEVPQVWLDQILVNYDNWKISNNPVFTHNQNHFDFNYLGIWMKNPEAVVYSYFLEGFDQTWSVETRTLTATYSSLPPGSYTFKVRAKNENGIWSSPENNSFSFEVEKPFWEEWWFHISLLLMVILAISAAIRYRTQKLLADKEILEKEVENRTQEIRKQKNIIEHKSNEILSSITYAKRIQEAILPPARLVKAALPNSFVLYKPKDIVAGDFYWMETVDDLVIFAAADCTGHGVPGAMVSVVCSNALNRAVREFGLTEPAKILDKTLELVIERFEKSEEEVKDGMDLALCALNKKTNELQYAGANNPLWIIKGESADLQETKATKQPVGKYADPKPYVNHSIQLSVSDSIYIFSDGYPDQFGGEKGKKLKTKAFKELLISIQNKSMNEQHQIIDDYFENWRGDQEQIDDVCVIGVRV